jgi:hypothetical protein
MCVCLVCGGCAQCWVRDMTAGEGDEQAAAAGSAGMAEEVDDADGSVDVDGSGLGGSGQGASADARDDEWAVGGRGGSGPRGAASGGRSGDVGRVLSDLPPTASARSFG